MRSIAFNCMILGSIYSTIEMILVNFKFFCLKSFWGVKPGWIGGWVGGRVALDCCSQILNFTKSLERRTGLKWQLVHCGGERKVRAGLITLVDAKRKGAKPKQWKDAVTFTPVPHSGQDSSSRLCTRQSTFFLWQGDQQCFGAGTLVLCCSALAVPRLLSGNGSRPFITSSFASQRLPYI